MSLESALPQDEETATDTQAQDGRQPTMKNAVTEKNKIKQINISRRN